MSESGLSEGEELSDDFIDGLLTTQRTSTARQQLESTRDIVSWFKLNHFKREGGCDNPKCVDPRAKDDPGKEIVSMIERKHICRFCFLDGWLLDEKQDD